MCGSADRHVRCPSCSTVGLRRPGRPRAASLRPVPSGPRGRRHGGRAADAAPPSSSGHRSLIAAIVASPLLLAAVLLATRPWAPVLDMAMTELRVRDVGSRHTPLIGLPGRIGNFPDQGSHPGPLSFYLLAPFYRLTGSTAWGLELGSVAINTAAVALFVWIGHRRAGLLGTRRLRRDRRRRRARLRAERADASVEPVLPGAALARRARCRVVGAGRRSLDGASSVVAASVAAQTHVSYLLERDRDERARVGGRWAGGCAGATQRPTVLSAVPRHARHRGRALDPAVRRSALPRPRQHHAC